MKVNHITYARKSDGSWVEVTTVESPDGEVEETEEVVAKFKDFLDSVQPEDFAGE